MKTLLRATVTRNGKTREVKNLGWLLANWRSVTGFTVEPHPVIDSGFQPDAVLIAHLRCGGEYRTGFYCLAILKDFLDRPVFRGVNIAYRNFVPPTPPRPTRRTAEEV